LAVVIVDREIFNISFFDIGNEGPLALVNVVGLARPIVSVGADFQLLAVDFNLLLA